MTYPSTEIDKIGLELSELSDAYAARAAELVSDPYFREAIVKTSVSHFVWSLFNCFEQPTERAALIDELRNQLAVVERADRVEGDRSSNGLEAIDHVQLAMPAGEEAAARAFYGDLLGLAERPKPAELARRGGCWFEGDGVKVHLGVETPFAPARKAHIAFRVADVAQLAARARAGNFTVVDDEALPGHARVYIYDPFGNRLEFLRPL